MIPVWDYRQIEEQLTRNFNEYGHTNHVRMVGLLFARPQSTTAKEQILPSLRDFHYSAGKNIDFYCAGYNYGKTKPVHAQPAREDLGWEFNSDIFNKFKREVESRTKWKYSGEADLILLNARMDGKKAKMSFKTCIVCDLAKMIKEESIASVSGFFEDIFRYAASQDGTNPTWCFSNQMGTQVGGSALKNAIIDLLLKRFSESYKQVSNFAIRDIDLKE